MHQRLRAAYLRLRNVVLTLLVCCLAVPALAQGDAQRDYVIGIGDVLRINVYQNPDLSLETRVSESGTISYPLLGQVKLGGLSVAQAEKAIGDGLRTGNFVKQPQVNLLLMQVKGNQASVLGLVAKPGRYPLEVSGTRLSELLAAAGGIAPDGSDILTFSGIRNGKLVRVQLDIGKLASAGSLDQDPVVQNGDIIYVDRAPMIYIYGEVQRPGTYRLGRGLTVMQALATGGGLTAKGTNKGMKIHRRGTDGKVNEYDAQLNDSLSDGDVIYVRQSLF
ncbi:MAG: polysaccharide export protein EpsE [Burkholderiales bacterium]